MSKCVSCQSETNSQTFCKVCGAAQDCSGCHEPFEENGDFCTSCGKARNVTTKQASPSTKGAGAASSKKNMVIGGGIILAILLLFVGTKFVNGTLLNSPEKTVDRFLDSMLKGDVAKATDYFNPALMDGFSGVEMDEIVGAPITVKSVETVSETSTMASVDASLVYKENTDDEDSNTASFEVVKIKGKWYINEIY
ncbi:DUF4878 domain-containing protein [Rossellomorea marisflavi]|uniref:hypothetical protein n=1 Tax=Rossellomorea marisflavi TaxID=189381 RepID=UPI0034599D5F